MAFKRSAVRFRLAPPSSPEFSGDVSQELDHVRIFAGWPAHEIVTSDQYTQPTEVAFPSLARSPETGSTAAETAALWDHLGRMPGRRMMSTQLRHVARQDADCAVNSVSSP